MRPKGDTVSGGQRPRPSALLASVSASRFISRGTQDNLMSAHSLTRRPAFTHRSLRCSGWRFQSTPPRPRRSSPPTTTPPAPRPGRKSRPKLSAAPCRRPAPDVRGARSLLRVFATPRRDPRARTRVPSWFRTKERGPPLVCEMPANTRLAHPLKPLPRARLGRQRERLVCASSRPSSSTASRPCATSFPRA
jgi:hypothetical protein